MGMGSVGMKAEIEKKEIDAAKKLLQKNWWNLESYIEAEWQNWEMGKRKQEPEEWSQVRADWRNNTEAKGDASFQRNMTWWRRKCGSGIESWLLHFLAAW